MNSSISADIFQDQAEDPFQGRVRVGPLAARFGIGKIEAHRNQPGQGQVLVQPFEKGLVHIVVGPVGQDQDRVHGDAAGHPQDSADGPVRSHRQREGTNLHICLSPRQGKPVSFIGEEFTLFSSINSSS